MTNELSVNTENQNPLYELQNAKTLGGAFDILFGKINAEIAEEVFNELIISWVRSVQGLKVRPLPNGQDPVRMVNEAVDEFCKMKPTIDDSMLPRNILWKMGKAIEPEAYPGELKINKIISDAAKNIGGMLGFRK